MTEDLHIITCSYGPDLTRCRRLCRSVDEYVDEGIPHTLVVPARDREAFAPLARGRRTLVVAEDILPASYRRLPGSQRWWFDEQGWPVRGWIVQQLTKLCADRVTRCEALLFADSDLQFIRPFEKSDVFRDGLLRLHRVPGAKSEGMHRKWHRKAGELLGIPRRYTGADYVGQLITWRREHLVALKARIQSVTGRPWHRAVGRSLRFSEYILYGAYVDVVLGMQRAGHFPSDDALCHCCWFAEEAEALARGEEHIGDRSVALLLQSNLGLAPGREAAILDLAHRQLRTH
jgi:hypothetical protein